MLQEPLSFLGEIPLEQRLLIIGGKTLPISRVVTVVDSIDSLSDKHVSSETSVICLPELEKPIFASKKPPVSILPPIERPLAHIRSS
ncbi:polyketide synthase [Fusarium circinatum]|uniref:Polyketide synthase n=1 Tax=Fusarium circinatum TaxID=48490 RepID=A0A8H5UE21_FUSCI|nr:polyketide synthase [Fusarium circinatum]